MAHLGNLTITDAAYLITHVSALDAIAARASRHTGRTLRWVILAGRFFLDDDTHHGGLQLALLPDGGLFEVYMRIRHFGLTPADCACITQALRDATTDQPQTGAERH